MIKPTREEIRSIAVREKSVQMLIDRCGVGQAEANQIVTQLLTEYWGPRCKERFEPQGDELPCDCCEAWREFDELVQRNASEAAIEKTQ